MLRRPNHAGSARAFALVVVASVGLMAACSLPEGDRVTPEGAHYELLEVRQSGDTGALWEMMHPDVQGLVATWHAAEKETLFAIENIYPDEHKAPALEALDGGERGRLPTPRALFEYLMEDSVGDNLATMAALGARASSVALDGDKAIISTWAGDRVYLRKGPGDVWFATLSPTEQAALAEAIRDARANRERVMRNKQIFRGELPGGAQ